MNNIYEQNEVAKNIEDGKVVMLGSDTLYGLHANAFNPDAVGRIYEIKQREADKPFIILISDISDLKKFGVEATKSVSKKLKSLWPGKVSIIFGVNGADLEYLHRGKNSLAFRIPDKKDLINLLKQTGPLVSTTVNISGEPSINNVEEAKQKFGDVIDLYVEEGEIVSEPSTVIKFKDNEIIVMREGAVKVDVQKNTSTESSLYNVVMKSKLNIVLTIAILLLVAAGVTSNVMQQRAVTNAKLQPEIALSGGFQRWITNLKNKGLQVEGDEFRLLESTAVFNSQWLKVASLNTPGEEDIYNNTLKSMQKVKKVVFSPDNTAFVDYRNEVREGALPTQVKYYGLKGDKVLDANVIDCSALANCYFDRAYFIDNDTFVVSEFSRNIDKKDTTAAVCKTSETCTYTIKVHVVNLLTNSRLEYQSKPMDLVLDKVIPEL